MDSTKVLSLLETLDDEIDDLEESLQPLIKTALSESASKLPLLDKAKLYVLTTYAIETILFSYLRLNGVKAREHAVFKELTRVKQYFDKIKRIEAPVVERSSTVDKGAAARFIKAGLAGNDKYDLERAELQAKERAKAHIKFNDLAKGVEKKDHEKKRKAEETPQEEESDSSDSDSDSEKEVAKPVEATPIKKRKGDKSASNTTSGTSTSEDLPNQKQKKLARQQRQKAKKAKKSKKPEAGAS